MGITSTWRDETRDVHSNIEATELSRALFLGEVTRATYALLLAQMAAIHAVLDHALETTDRHGVYAPHMARLPHLYVDLAAFAAMPPPAPLPATRRFIAELDSLAKAEPVALLGVLYVLEGSRMGSLMLGPRIAAGFGLPRQTGVGLDYHLADAEHIPARWRATKARMDAALEAPAAARAATTAVRHTFERMTDIYHAVWQAAPAAAAATAPLQLAEKGA